MAKRDLSNRLCAKGPGFMQKMCPDCLDRGAGIFRRGQAFVPVVLYTTVQYTLWCGEDISHCVYTTFILNYNLS